MKKWYEKHEMLIADISGSIFMVLLISFAIATLIVSNKRSNEREKEFQSTKPTESYPSLPKPTREWEKGIPTKFYPPTESATEGETTQGPTNVSTEPKTSEIGQISSEKQVLSNEHVFLNIPLSEDLQIHTISECQRIGLDPHIAFAVMQKESNFNTNAIGDGGESVGIMQVQPKWWGDFATENGLDIYSAKGNISIGILLIKRQVDLHEGDLARALTAYNSGRGDHISAYAQGVLKILKNLKGE